ncbi:MAG: dihydrodipicolinate synthase family protein [Betaproteobacteria bacterium]
MKLEFKGMFPAPPTPVTEDGRINEKALRALLEDNIAHGANGFWMAGTTGEGPILTDDQRDAVARISAEVCKDRALAIMHVGAISTASAVKAAKTAKSAGCDAVCCLPPFFFPSSERARIEHYKAVADAAGDLPFFVYNLPQLTQVETVPALMEKFVRAIPTLKGLKHSAPNFADIRIFADMGLICFSGNGAFPLPALTMGAVGTVDAPLSVAPWHYAELYSAWKAGDMGRAQALQNETRKYVDLVWMFFAMSDVCKAVLSERLGVDCGRSVPPVNRLNDEEKREVLRVAELLGLTQRREHARGEARLTTKQA